MAEIDDGGLAFPGTRYRKVEIDNGDWPETKRIRESHAGMSLRDWFAGQAVSGLMGRRWEHLGEDAEVTKAWATAAYAVADAMLAARKQQGR